MSLRQLALPLAVCAITLVGSVAHAQSVFAPSDDSGSSSQGGGASPFYTPPSDTQPGQGGGSSGTGGFTAGDGSTAAPAPTYTPPPVSTQQAVRPSQRPVPSGQRNEFAYRTMGIEVPNDIANPGDPLASYTPEQIEIARKGFAAMEADNPQMASRNPFRQIDAMANAQKAQDAIVTRAKAACDVQSFNVMVSPQSFMRDPAASEGLNKTGVAMVGNLLQQLCSDRQLRDKMANSVPMITIVNRTGGAAEVITTDGIITLSADFANPEPPPPAQLRASFVKAIEDTDKFMQTPASAPQTR